MSPDKIFIFFLFLGPLIFFHELGHFLIARFFGVKVETFSIGFGPKIFKFKKGDTTYAWSLIPLGGYVKMFGDDPFRKDEIPEEERAISYTHKSKWARFWIVFGGPLANFLLAGVIYFGLNLIGEEVPELRFGTVVEKSELFDLGFRTGDKIKAVNGESVNNGIDLLGDNDNKVHSVTVERLGKNVKLNFKYDGKDLTKLYGVHFNYLLSPVVYNKDGKKFTLKTPGIEKLSFNEIVQFKEIDAVTIVDSETSEEVQRLTLVDPSSQSRRSFLIDQGYYPSDISVAEIKKGSPASRTDLKPNDIITHIDGKPLSSFEDMKKFVQASTGDQLTMTFISDGIEKKATLTPEITRVGNETVKLIGVHSGGVYLPIENMKLAPKPFFQAIGNAFHRTYSTLKRTYDGFMMLLTGEVSIKNVGGPITIHKMANSVFDKSLTFFIQTMALFSINLGFINLLPIPVLDGGHILFIAIEALKGGPLSRRKMEIAQQLGLSIILLLMVGAVFNDILRYL